MCGQHHVFHRVRKLGVSSRTAAIGVQRPGVATDVAMRPKLKNCSARSIRASRSGMGLRHPQSPAAAKNQDVRRRAHRRRGLISAPPQRCGPAGRIQFPLRVPAPLCLRAAALRNRRWFSPSPDAAEWAPIELGFCLGDVGLTLARLKIGPKWTMRGARLIAYRTHLEHFLGENSAEH